MAGGFGICGMAKSGVAATAGAGAAPPPCKSRSAEPEMTRVNSPGPLTGADGAGGGMTAGADAGIVEAKIDGADATGAGAGAIGRADGGAGAAGSAESVRSNCVNPPAAAAGAGVGADGIG